MQSEGGEPGDNVQPEGRTPWSEATTNFEKDMTVLPDAVAELLIRPFGQPGDYPSAR